MANLFLRSAGMWVPIGSVEGTPPPVLPPGTQSYWPTVAPVAGGWELNPAVSKKAGIPPGANLTPGASNTINTTNAVITDKTFVGVVNVNATGVTFVRCRFTASGYVPHSSPGASDNVVNAGNNAPSFVDCEFLGGDSTSVVGGSFFKRCLFVEGNDQLRIRGPLVRLEECVFDGCLRADQNSHSDCIQATTNSPSTTQFDLRMDRCWENAYNRFTDDPHNAVVQSGGYGSAQGGMRGQFNDCFFDGGNYSFQGDAGGGGIFVFRRNRFGRNQRFGAISSAFRSTSDIDNTNVWADNLQPVLGS